jgi:hypothetical protein
MGTGPEFVAATNIVSVCSMISGDSVVKQEATKAASCGETPFWIASRFNIPTLGIDDMAGVGAFILL